MSIRASKRFTIIIFALTAAVIAFAFIHSSMPAEVSQGESGGVLDFLVRILKAIGLCLQAAPIALTDLDLIALHHR